jgi:2-polyprenyl-3-methyl-5-hydroxy-6-metoxy-1,4-benzoquinol methylase
MKYLDRFIQRARFKKALKHLPKGASVLDIGSGEGDFLEYCGDHISIGFGIDKNILNNRAGERYKIIQGAIPDALKSVSSFEVVTMLAVLEHIPEDDLEQVVTLIQQILTPGGRLILTIPSPKADILLTILRGLRLIDGMCLEEHHGFDVEQVFKLFSDLRLILHQKFQFGFNNIFVFHRPTQ